MNYRPLGKTGQSVSEISLGTCFMAEQGQDNLNRCVAFALNQGVNYFDTAADYGRGNDERMLGAALKGRRDQAFLATKVGYTDDPLDHRRADGLMRQFDQSLQRLQTDHVDVIQIHEADFRKWWKDYDLSPEEGMNHHGILMRDEEAYDFASAPAGEFLRRAKASGKARFIGLTAKNARLTARLLEHIEVDSLMTAHQFNPLLRNAAEFLFPITEKKGIGVVLGAALMKGWLAVPQTAWKTNRPDWMDEVFYNAYFQYVALCEKAGLSLAEVSIRWMLSEKRQHSIVFGFASLDIVKNNLDIAAKGELPTDLRAAIDAIGLVHPLIYQNRQTL